MDSAPVGESVRGWGRRAPRRGASAESLGLSHTTLTGVESWVSEATPATGSIPQAECWLSGPVPCDGSPASHLTIYGTLSGRLATDRSASALVRPVLTNG